jgi:dsDNA-specific endonuclease/ATPase MutS2
LPGRDFVCFSISLTDDIEISSPLADVLAQTKALQKLTADFSGQLTTLEEKQTREFARCNQSLTEAIGDARKKLLEEIVSVFFPH